MFIKMMVSFLHNSVKEPNRMRQELILKPRIVKSFGPWLVIICMTCNRFLMICKQKYLVFLELFFYKGVIPVYILHVGI